MPITFPVPTDQERKEWVQQYMHNQWDALKAIFEQASASNLTGRSQKIVSDTGVSHSDCVTKLQAAINLYITGSTYSSIGAVCIVVDPFSGAYAGTCHCYKWS